MKKLGIVLRAAACVLFVLSSLGFAAVMGWQLVSGDWKLFENEGLIMAQLVVKMLLSLYCFAISLCAVLRRKPGFFWEGLQLLVITLAAAPFISNHLGWLFVFFAGLFLISEPCIWEPGLDRRGKKGEKRC